MRYVLFFPKAGDISDPRKATQNVPAAAERHGAIFMFGQRVASIERAGGLVGGGDHDAAPLVYDVPPIDYELNMAFCPARREIDRAISFPVVG